MSKMIYERLHESDSDFNQDIEWARGCPEYWSEKFKLDVAALVTSELDRLGLSQVELARRMGTSAAFVTKMLRGYHNWTPETLAKVGVALGIQWRVASAPIDGDAQAITPRADAPATPAALGLSASAQSPDINLTQSRADWTGVAEPKSNAMTEEQRYVRVRRQRPTWRR